MPGPSKQLGKAVSRRIGSSVGLGGVAGGAAYALWGAVLGGVARTDIALGAGLGVASLLAVFGESLFKHLSAILRARGAAGSATSLADAQARVTVIQAKSHAQTQKHLYRTGTKRAKTAQDVEKLIRLFQDPGSGPADGGRRPLRRQDHAWRRQELSNAAGTV
jgi:hypothetical protein